MYNVLHNSRHHLLRPSRFECLKEDLLQLLVTLVDKSQKSFLLKTGALNRTFEVYLRGDQLLLVVVELLVAARGEGVLGHHLARLAELVALVNLNNLMVVFPSPNRRTHVIFHRHINISCCLYKAPVEVLPCGLLDLADV